MKMKSFECLILLLSLYKGSFCYKVTSIPIDSPSKIGYSPHWDGKSKVIYTRCCRNLVYITLGKSGRLLFADQFSKNATICQFEYSSSKTFCATIEGEEYASAVIPVKGCKSTEFVVALRKSIKVVKWNGHSKTAYVTKEIYSIGPNDGNSMDTAKADPTGRLYFGTYGEKICGATSNSSLYSYSRKEGVQLVLSGFKSCFGIAFNNKTNKCYFMDTCSYTISELDWDRKTGQLSNSHVVYTLEVIPGKPSYIPFGLDIDSENNFYVGSYGGGSLLKIKLAVSGDPDGDNCTTVEEIEMPSKLVGCPTFGGPNLTDIFVTSSSLYLDFYTGKPIQSNSDCKQKRTLVKTAPEDGSLLKIEQSVLKGVPANNVCLC